MTKYPHCPTHHLIYTQGWSEGMYRYYWCRANACEWFAWREP